MSTTTIHAPPPFLTRFWSDAADFRVSQNVNDILTFSKMTQGQKSGAGAEKTKNCRHLAAIFTIVMLPCYRGGQ